MAVPEGAHLLVVPEGAPSVPSSFRVLPGDSFHGNHNELLRLVTLEMQGHIDYHWEQQLDQWQQLRNELREHHEELMKQLSSQMRDALRMAMPERSDNKIWGTDITIDSGNNLLLPPTPASAVFRVQSAATAASVLTPIPATASATLVEEATGKARKSMFNWTTVRLAKVERRVSGASLSMLQRFQEWFAKMFVVPPSFKRKKPPTSTVERLVSSNAFLAFSALLIISDAVYLGWYANFSFKNELSRIDWGTFDKRPWIGNVILEVFFLLEVSMRFCGLGFKKYFNFWNALDLLIAITVVSSLFEPSENVHRYSYLLIIRLFRLIHTCPLFRLPLFAHLRMITNALIHSLPSFFWVVTFGALFLYICGVGFCLEFAHELQNKQLKLGELSPARHYFSNIVDAMIYLYMALTNGIDWGQIYDAVKKCDRMMGIGLFCFSVFMVFAVMNIISAMFIERAFNVIRDDRDFWVVEEARRQKRHRQRIFGLFDEMDKDGSGDVTWDEFERALDNPHIEAYLSFVDLDVSNLHDIFHLLDKDRNGSVDIHEFLDGLEVLKGPAKRVEVLRMYDLVRDLIEAEMSKVSSIKQTSGKRQLNPSHTAEIGAVEDQSGHSSPSTRVTFGEAPPSHGL